MRRPCFVLVLGLVLCAAFTAAVHASCSQPLTADITVTGPNDDGIAHLDIFYSIPDTASSSERTVTYVVTGGGVVSTGDVIHPSTTSGTWSFDYSLSCRLPGTYTFTALVSCPNRSAEDSQAVSFEAQPAVSVNYTGPDAAGHGKVVVNYNFPRTSSPDQRLLSHTLQGGGVISGGPTFRPTQRQGVWEFDYNMTCRTGTYTHVVNASHCNGLSAEGRKDVTVDSTPIVSVSLGPPDDDGVLPIDVNYAFPHTDSPSQRTVSAVIHFPGGAISTRDPIHPAGQSGTYKTSVDVACLPPNALTIEGIAQSCTATRQASVPYTPSHTPAVSVQADPADLSQAIVHYDFTGTGSSSQRTVRLFWADGTLIGERHPNQKSGDEIFALAACDPRALKAAAIACGDQTVENSAPGRTFAPPQITNLTLRKSGIDVATGRRIIEGILDYDLGSGGGSGVVRADVVSWRTADGQLTGGFEALPPFTPATQSGTRTFTFLAPSGAQQVIVRGTATGCSGRGTKDAAAEDCDSCEGTHDPVYFNSGNVRVTDGDPLPLIAGHGLQRTYNSDEQVSGRFGRGWTSLLDSRVVVNTDGGEQLVGVVTESNDVALFRGSAGAFRQTFPTARETMSTLTYNAGSGAYTFRRAGSQQAWIYGPDGRLAAIRDLAGGHEAQIAYNTNIITVTDSWSQLAWNLSTDPSSGRVTSIAVSGRPDLTWNYSYDANGNLTAVNAPGNTPWRTYEYVFDRMTASKDALGNLIESHTYDGPYGVSSTGPQDEIASIQYNLAGSTAEERITRVTQKTGYVTDYVLQRADGVYRIARVVGDCASCGGTDVVHARDSRGRVVRTQDARGYIHTTTYSDASLTPLVTTTALRPASCDPAASATQCRLTPAELAAASLVPTDATLITNYEYANANWPDRPTAIVTESIVQPAASAKRTTFTYDAATGAVLMRSTSGWNNGVYETRTSSTTLYNGSEAAAFDPGGSFAPGWRVLPQPAGLPKWLDGPLPEPDLTLFVYYPVDPSVPGNLRGRLAAVRNALGHVTRHENYDVFGNVTRTVDPNGTATEASYDALGRLLTHSWKGTPGCDPVKDPLCASDLTASRTYFAAGPLKSEQRAGGGVTLYSYDPRGRVRTISRGPSATDLREQLESSYDLYTGKKDVERSLAWDDGGWVEKRRESFLYDARGLLHRVLHADLTFIEYGYDAARQLESVRDENHGSANTTYHYDAAGRMDRVAQRLLDHEVVTRYVYDRRGNLAGVIDPNGNLTSYVYNDFDEMTAQSSPVTGTTSYGYDPAGRLYSTSDANGATTTYSYDLLGRVTQSTAVHGTTETVTRQYDDPTAGRYGIGRMASMTDPAGTTTYLYERRGLLRKELRSFPGAAYGYTTAYFYDADGNRSSVLYPSSQLVVPYTFDYAGRPLTAGGIVTAAAYHPFGPLRQLTFGNGTTQTFDYDQRYRLARNTLAGAAGPLAQFAYQYDAVGNITMIQDLLDSSYDRQFGYDDLNRLTGTTSGSALWRTGSYTWDNMGNLLASNLAQVAPREDDGLSRFVPQRFGGLKADTQTQPLGRSLAFTYDGTTPRITEVTTNDLSRPVQYDAAGNEVSYVITRAYSPRNLLETVTGESEPEDPFRHTVTYGYDGRGVRVSRAETPSDGTSGTAHRYYFYSPELRLMSVTRDNTGNVWAFSAADKDVNYEIVWFGDRPVAQIPTNGPLRYTVADHLGTPFLQTDPSGTVIWQAEYEPFGNIYDIRTGSRTDQPLRFPGQELENAWEGGEENYNIFRWYKAGWGRYTQADPIEFLSRDLNLYRYGRSNPLRFVDPLGLQTEPPPDNLYHFPNNPNTGPARSPFDCDDVRPFDPTRIPYSRTLEPRPITMNPRNIARGGMRATIVAALAYVNVKVWACAIARNYCISQDTMSYCECMQYADASNNCSALPAGGAFSCPPPPPPPANPPQNACCRK